MPANSILVRQRAGGVVVVTLNRPEARNAILPEDWNRLGEFVRAADETAKAIVLTGAGGWFSAGADLKTPAPVGVGPLGPASRVRHVHAALRSLSAARCPIVCAVEGFAIGAAWSLAMMCDLVVAAEPAYFSMPFVQRGLVPDGGAGWLLARRLGHVRAFEMLSTGRTVTAAEAHAVGLVSSLAPRGEALDQAVGIATTLAEGPAGAIAFTKHLLQSADVVSFEEYLNREEVLISLHAGGWESAEGRRAFQEGRTPNWTGVGQVRPTDHPIDDKRRGT